MEDISPSSVGYKTTSRELLAETGVLLLAALAIYFFVKRTYLMSAVIAGLVIVRFLFCYRKGDLIFFFLGFTLGAGNDLLSMYKHVYYYLPAPDISRLPIPMWMFLFWGEIFVFFRKLMRWGPFLGEPPQKVIDQPLFLDLLIVLLYRLIIYRLASRFWVPDAIFATILVLRLLVSPPAKNERWLMLTMLVLGPAYEIWLIHCGLYVYQTGFLWGMPIWLIIYWVFIVRLLKAVYDRVEFYLIQKMK
jgi:hypothetical protein